MTTENVPTQASGANLGELKNPDENKIAALGVVEGLGSVVAVIPHPVAKVVGVALPVAAGAAKSHLEKKNNKMAPT